ncbi:hypothetical protein [Herpetosiphon gulosus]|uniref:Uncharacterized protein n=1 Tax=Herpetosiphon gulosus TaxID=1973496 RepID=A0ABP9X9C2_9CHLR
MSKAEKLINTEVIPDKRDIYLWSDYIELLCLVNIDGEISTSSITNMIRKDDDISPDFNEYGLTPENNDKEETFLNDCFRQIQYRIGLFDDFYPFILSSDNNTLIKKQVITENHNLYLFLLFASSMSNIPSRAMRNKLAKSFEILSQQYLRIFLPSFAQVYGFGAGSNERYTGKLLSKLQKLAEDLNCRFIGSESDYNVKNSGDGGIDIVGWIPLDTSFGTLSIFGQCACTLEWVKKQLTASAERWRTTFNFQPLPITMCFIPFCFRDSDGDWYQTKDINSLLIDRVRLILLIKTNPDMIKSMELPELLQDYLSFREHLT